MMDLLTGLGGDLLAYLGIAVAAVLLWFGYGASKKREGRKDAETKAREKTLENVEKARKAEKRVADADPDERKRLRDKWTR